MSINRACTLTFLISLLLSACAAPAQPAALPAPTRTRLPVGQAQPTRAPGCTVVTRQLASGPTPAAPIPPIDAADWSLGAPDGAVTIMAYCDFQSPGCAYIAPVLRHLVDKYPDDLRIIYRHYPIITLYDKSALATQAAEAAGKQDKFWEMYGLLYSRQQEWSALSVEEFQEWLRSQTKDLEIDGEQFERDLTSPAVVKAVKDAYEKNTAIQMFGTPYLLLNGETYQGPPAFGDLDAIVALTLLKERQYSDCPPLTIDREKQYLAVLHTERGDIILELFADKAPLAVNSFVFLAREGWFDGVTFHRVLPGFMAQAGDPTGTGFGGPGYAFDNEPSDETFDRPGVLGMANAGPGSNGSQFFITYAAAPHLDGGFTIFGQLISGMDVLEKLTPRDPSKSGELPEGDAILSVEIQEK